MIKKISDLSDIRGSQPLMSVIQSDFDFPSGTSDSVFYQEINEEKTLVLSLHGVTAAICKLSSEPDIDELVSFLHFRGVTDVLSDFFFEGMCLKKRAVLRVSVQGEIGTNIMHLSPYSRLGEYKAVFDLLSCYGSFDVWYPTFSRKVNKFRAFGVYLADNGIPVSCAIAPFIYGEVGIIAGVFTDTAQRGKGLATRCVKALLSDMKQKNVEVVYLWCEDENVNLYKNMGFSVCGEIYVKKEE